MLGYQPSAATAPPWLATRGWRATSHVSHQPLVENLDFTTTNTRYTLYHRPQIWYILSYNQIYDHAVSSTWA
jgi:hypothetical protein